MSDPVPLKIDDVVFLKPTSGKEGTWEDDARYVTTHEAPQRYEVVPQPIPGFKTITQATEPVALKRLHVIVYTFTEADQNFMDGLDNNKPHAIQSPLFMSSPIMMYLESKTPRIYKTGLQPFALEWDMMWVEANDNN
jgi:hypothetical protein